MPAEPCVLVGRDVFAYNIQGWGSECAPAADTVGGVFNLLGRWRTITFEVEPNWADTTSSSAFWVTKRRTTYDFRATLEGLVEWVGSAPWVINEGNNLIKVVFQEIASGMVFTVIGGIARLRYQGQREEFTDTLEITCVGDVMGDGFPFIYAPSGGMELTGKEAGVLEAVKLINDAAKRTATPPGKKAA